MTSLLRPLTPALLAALLLVPAVPAAAAEGGPGRATGAPAVTVAEGGRVSVVRRDVPVPTRRSRGGSWATAADGSTAALVAAPPAAASRSTWQVTYTGFDSASNPTGPQARVAFQRAVDIWSRIVSSPVPIKVDASFAPLSGNTLGSAGPTRIYRGSAIGDGTSFYASALADALTGVDQAASNPSTPPFDISAQFTSAATANWYYGTDGAPGTGQVDFLSVVMHELGHGLGFAGGMSVDTAGTGSRRTPPLSYDRYPYDAAAGGSPLSARPTPSASLGSALRSQSVYWSGPAAVSATGGSRPRLYAPSAWEGGSSYSHLDEATYGLGSPHSLMTPSISSREAVHSPGPVAVGMLVDQGWTASLPTATPGAPTTVQATPGDALAAVSWAAPASTGSSAVTGYRVTASPGGASCTTTGALRCTVPGLVNGTGHAFTVTASSSVGSGPASAASATVVPAPAAVSAGAGFTPLRTARVFDGTVGTSPVPVQVAGRGGVPAGATAVVVNVQVFAPTQASTVRVTPRGEDAQVATQRFAAGETVSNLATVTLVDGMLDARVGAGSARLLMDVAGYYGSGGSTFVPLSSARTFDGQVGTGNVPVQISGRTGVPTSATAVAVNVQVFAPTAASYLRVTPFSEDAQVATQEFSAGETVSNLVIAKLVDGKVQVKVAAGSARVLVDVAGYFSPGAGSTFTPLSSQRTFDGVVGATQVPVQVNGLTQVPAGATAVVVNVEVAAPTAAGYVRVTPFGQDAQVATQEFVRGQGISALVVAKVVQGQVQLKLNTGSGRVLLDVAGFYS